MAKANSYTKCSNYNKCKYTGKCGIWSTSHAWLTTADSDVTVDGCWKGVNYKKRELSAGDRQTCNDLDESPEINS